MWLLMVLAALVHFFVYSMEIALHYQKLRLYGSKSTRCTGGRGNEKTRGQQTGRWEEDGERERRQNTTTLREAE
jgi:hypothetical protein